MNLVSFGIIFCLFFCYFINDSQNSEQIKSNLIQSHQNELKIISGELENKLKQSESDMQSLKESYEEKLNQQLTNLDSSNSKLIQDHQIELDRVKNEYELTIQSLKDKINQNEIDLEKLKAQLVGLGEQHQNELNQYKQNYGILILQKKF